MSYWRVKSITASAQVSAAPWYVAGIHQEGSDAHTCALADKATDSGTRVMGAAGAANVVDNVFPGGNGVVFLTACYATLTGTTPRTEIYWRPKTGSS